MTGYKHYSFDLWLTLIRSNPLFKQRRSSYFHEHFNIAGKPVEEVESVFRFVDVMCTAMNEKTGKNIRAEEMYLMVISIINDNRFPLVNVDLDALFSAMDELIFEHLPTLYCERTAETLAQIAGLPGSTMNILSNTGFVQGPTLRKVLKQLEIDIYFDFQIYSDEVGVSKPGKAIFDLMLKEVRAIRELQLSEIIHVGDNPHADINGAGAMGIHSLLVNSNGASIVKLITHASQDILTA